MDIQQHPITPPPDKFKRWEDDILNDRENVDVVLDCAWKDGYRAGADAELEACCEWVDSESLHLDSSYLRADRRPKPPSLAEQALEELDLVPTHDQDGLSIDADTSVIRRALERLKELEKGNE